MPGFLQALKSIVGTLGLADPLAPWPLPYAAIAAHFPPPPQQPACTDGILEFLGGDTSGSMSRLHVPMALAAALFGILRLCKAAIGELDGDFRDEWRRRAHASLLHREEAKEEATSVERLIEKELVERMEAEARGEKDLVERMEMEAEIDNDLVGVVERLGAQPNGWLNAMSGLSFATIRAGLADRSGRSSQVVRRARRSRRRDRWTVSQEKRALEGEPRDVPDILNITDSSGTSCITDISGVAEISDTARPPLTADGPAISEIPDIRMSPNLGPMDPASRLESVLEHWRRHGR